MFNLIRRMFNRSNPTVVENRIQLGKLVTYGNVTARIIEVGEFSVTLLDDNWNRYENVPPFMCR